VQWLTGARYQGAYLCFGLKKDVFVLLETGQYRKYRMPQPY
jgi:hypothetical protein